MQLQTLSRATHRSLVVTAKNKILFSSLNFFYQKIFLLLFSLSFSL